MLRIAFAVTVLVVAVTTAGCQRPSCGLGQTIDDDGCTISSLCDTDANGTVETGVDASVEYTCDGADAAGVCTCDNAAQNQFEGGCLGTKAEQALRLKNECSFDIYMDPAFCENDLAGAAAECNELSAE